MSSGGQTSTVYRVGTWDLSLALAQTPDNMLDELGFAW